MAAKKTTTNNIEEVEEIKKTDEAIYFKANKPLTMAEHKSLHEKIEYEMKKTGLKIILVPFFADVGESNE